MNNNSGGITGSQTVVLVSAAILAALVVALKLIAPADDISALIGVLVVILGGGVGGVKLAQGLSEGKAEHDNNAEAITANADSIARLANDLDALRAAINDMGLPSSNDEPTTEEGTRP